MYDRIPSFGITVYGTQSGKVWMLQDTLQISVHDQWLFKISDCCKEAGVYELTFRCVQDKANVTKPMISPSFIWF